MSTHQVKTWLVAYDIREPRRLRRVHRHLRKLGMAAQYSAFTVEADDSEIVDHLAAIESLIDKRVDDVRAYHLPARCPVWRLGRQEWPEGLYLSPLEAVRLLQATASTGDADEVSTVLLLGAEAGTAPST